MGLEGAVRLGFRKELEALPEGAERDALFAKLLAKSYANGEAMHMATTLEIDAVIDPAELAQLHGLPIPAASSGRIDTIIFPGALLPSTSVIRTVDALAALGGRR